MSGWTGRKDRNTTKLEINKRNSFISFYFCRSEISLCAMIGIIFTINIYKISLFDEQFRLACSMAYCSRMCFCTFWIIPSTKKHDLAGFRYVRLLFNVVIFLSIAFVVPAAATALHNHTSFEIHLLPVASLIYLADFIIVFFLVRASVSIAIA